MPVNDFLGFASAQDANVSSQEAYASSTEKDRGMTSGPASSAMCNKVWRQGANMAAALGRFIAAKGYDALDDGNLDALAKSFTAAVCAVAPYDLTVDYPAGAIVKDSSNVLYFSIAPNGPSTTIADPTNTAFWAPFGSGGGGGTGLESYSATKNYAAGAVVLYNGGLYIAVAANGPASTVAAPTNPAFWTEFITEADFNALGFTGITAYSTAVDYSVGAVVVNNGELFFCIQANGPSSTVYQPGPGQNTAYWAQIYHNMASAVAAGFMSPADKEKLNTLSGVFIYDSSKSYLTGAVVNYLGKVYICVQANGSSDPKVPTNRAYWHQIVTGTATTSAAGLMSPADKKRLDENVGVYLYSNQTDYAYGDIVEYGYGLYGCVQANGPSSVVVAPDGAGASAYWLDIINGVAPGALLMPSYDATVNYLPGALVASGNNIFMAKAANGPDMAAGVQPVTNSTYWAAFYACDPIVDITISGTTMTLTHASGNTATRTLPAGSYDNADTTNY